MITKYGLDIVLAVALVTVAAVVLSLGFLPNPIVRYGTIGLVGLAFLFALYFFRDPKSISPVADNLILSPADGKIVQVKDIFESEFLKSDGVQVSIFMSPLDVHVNRVPMSGRVSYYRYVKGDYLVAFEEKASERNERTHIGIENGSCRIFFRQIAGSLARRIVCTLREGDRVASGERFGMIKFGSRVDVVVPRGLDLKVGLHESVVGGVTVLAVIP
ncbi:MAG: phosphatidylserine decarboxylase family protein [Bacteroidota bacterium]